MLLKFIYLFIYYEKSVDFAFDGVHTRVSCYITYI